jgi:radical SAM/Cys-rich protein
MHATLPLLNQTAFPAIRRRRLETLQVNVGYRCNLSCLHCHVSAGPKRKEEMARSTAEQIVAFLDTSKVSTLDLTGGAPEMNANFRYLVREARERGLRVIDRCNLVILNEPGYENLAQFLADYRVDIVASLPCYLEENVDAQRGGSVYAGSIEALKKLNALGFGRPRSGLTLDLVYNPQGPHLPPPQQALEASYRQALSDRFGVAFNNLLTLANLPVGRFGSVLVSKGQFDPYMTLLKEAHQDANLDAVMCRSLLSVDWQGYLYDCDFNQMLGLPMRANGSPRTHLTQLLSKDVEGLPIAVRDHCYGCTAGQGSSCSGALR